MGPALQAAWSAHAEGRLSRELTKRTELVLWDLAPDGVLTLTWNRPDRKNAWTPDLEFAYFAALDRAQADADVRAVVVTGSGNAFCPGLDMQRLAKISGEGKLSIADRRPQYTPRLFTKPLIAAINGPCAGIGLIQALMADLRFAGTGARFSTAFTRRGLGPEYGMAWVLPRLIGVANAMDLLLSARTFGAEEAKELGIVNRLAGAGRRARRPLRSTRVTSRATALPRRWHSSGARSTTAWISTFARRCADPCARWRTSTPRPISPRASPVSSRSDRPHFAAAGRRASMPTRCSAWRTSRSRDRETDRASSGREHLRVRVEQRQHLVGADLGHVDENPLVAEFPGPLPGGAQVR